MKAERFFSTAPNGADTKQGKYGCAKVVSVALRKAGVDIPVLLGVAGIESALKGWKKIRSDDSLLPGDVVVWTSRFKGNKNGACTGSGTCHVGIYSDEGYFHNNPLGNRPIYNGLGLFFGYRFKYAFRPLLKTFAMSTKSQIAIQSGHPGAFETTLVMGSSI